MQSGNLIAPRIDHAMNFGFSHMDTPNSMTIRLLMFHNLIQLHEYLDIPNEKVDKKMDDD